MPALRSSISRKIVMALSGLWLCVFLTVHMAGNSVLFLPEELARPRYNTYSAFMAGNPLIQVLAYVNYLFILAHIVLSILLTVQNRRASGDRYARQRSGETSRWYSRSMGLLGAWILFFLVVHLRTFWYPYHFGEIGVDPSGLKDMYGVLTVAFARPWYVGLYVVSMAVLAFHLGHGFSSGFRTIGLHHRRYWHWVQWVGAIFAVGVSLSFALMPVYLFFASI